MCQAKVLVQNAEQEELVMKDVILLRIEGETVWLSRFFEDPVGMHATLEEVDFLKHTVRLKLLDDPKRSA